MSNLVFACILLFITNGMASDISPTLSKISELEKMALERSPELKSVRAFDKQKSAESYSRFTNHLPNAALRVRKEKDFFEERTAQLRALGLVTADSSWSINYEWSILNWANLSRTRKTITEAEKAELELSMKEKEFPISFRTHLLNYLLSKYKLTAVENSLKKAETGKKEAQLGYDLGQKTKIDVLRSEANYVSLNSKKTTYIDEEQNTKSRLLEYSGLSASDLEIFKSLTEDQTLAVIHELTNVPSINQSVILEKSPQYQQLVHEEKINKLSLEELTRLEYPDLSLQGSYTSAGETFDQSLHQGQKTHTVALVLNIPLFSGGSFASTQFEKYYASKRVELTIGRQKQELENNLNNALIKIDALKTLVSSLTLNVSQFEELYRLSYKSYQLGKGSLFELLEVQDDLLDAKISLAQNKIQYYTLSQNTIWQAGF